MTRALLQRVASDPAARRGLGALLALSSQTTDFQARRLAALRMSLSEVALVDDLKKLAATVTPDSGWGFDRQARVADALDTALALRALVGSGALTNTGLLKAIARLSALQDASGGFSQATGEPADLGTSAEVLLAVSAIGLHTNVDILRDRTAAFLNSGAHADGGFPAYLGGPADVTMTALVMSALLESGTSVAALAPARNYLRSSQLANGSWQNDVYTTALAIRILDDEKPDLALDAIALTSVSVAQGNPIMATVVVRNIGLAPSPMTTVALFAGDPNASGTSLGSMPVGTLEPQQAFSHLFSIDTRQLSGGVALFAVVDPSSTVSEISKANNRRFASLFVRAPGTLPDPSDNQSPIITNIAPRTVVTGTTYTHVVTAIDPENEAVTYGILLGTGIPGPVSITIDSNTGYVSWLADVPGFYFFNLRATDPQGAVGVQTVNLEVLSPDDKRPPQFESSPLSATNPGFLYRYVVQVRDPDGGPVTVRLAQAPAGMVLDEATSTVRWNPTTSDVGEHLVRLVASDDENTSTEQQWKIFVDAGQSKTVDLVAVLIDAANRVTDSKTLATTGTVRVKVANQGNDTVGAFSVVVYEDTDGVQVFSAADRALGRVSVPTLGSGATTELTIALSGQSLFLGNRLYVVVDADHAVKEIREDNNITWTGRKEPVLTVPGSFQPQVTLDWRGTQIGGGTLAAEVFSGPILVAQLNDDDGNGRAGEGDRPDIIARVSDGAAWNQITVNAWVAIDGRSGAKIAEFPYFTTVATGDLNRDGFPELVGYDNGFVSAYSHAGVEIWRTAVSLRTADIALADLEGDGTAEVVMGGEILNGVNGQVRCHFAGGGTDVAVADLDQDGRLDVITNFAAFSSDCSVLFRHNRNGGFAVGQLDADPEPEIAVVEGAGGGLSVLEHTGALKWNNRTSPFWGGTPAIGDIDGDGNSEIVQLTGGEIIAYESDGTRRWGVPYNDGTGVSTLPTLADLDGDGRVEVVAVNDESFFILSGTDGRELFRGKRGAGSGNEYPVIADANGDGRLDLVFGLNHLPPGTEGDPNRLGIRVWSDPSWAGGRPIWNQLGYHVTNIGCDQTIPRREPRPWEAHNTWLAQREVPEAFAEELNCPLGVGDLSASYLRVDRAACSAQVRYVVRIGNGGSRTISPGVRVIFKQSTGNGAPTLTGEVLTTRSLGPGQFEDVSLTAPTPGTGLFTTYVEVSGENAADDPPANNTVALSTELCDVANRQPTFSSLPSLEATVDEVYAYQPLFGDPDHDVINLALTTAPAGMALTNPPGYLIWTPTVAQLGPNPVTLQITDGRGGLAVQDFIVVVKRGTVRPEEPPSPATNLRLMVATDATSYAARSTAQIAVTVSNDENRGRSGTLAVEVLNAADEVETTLRRDDTVLFVGPDVQHFLSSFDVGLSLVGQYRVRARYMENGKETVATSEFTILPDAALQVALWSDRASYGASQTVQLTRRVQNVGRTGSLDNLTSTVRVRNGSAQIVFEEAQARFSVAPGALVTGVSSISTVGLPPGTYRARFEVKRAGLILGTVDAMFSVGSQSLLAGSLVAEPDPVPKGAAVSLTSAITNQGNAPVSGEALFTITDAGTLAVVLQAARPVVLGPGESSTSSASFDTAGLPEKTYLATVEVSQSGTRLLTLTKPLVIFRNDPPLVTIDAPACTAAAQVTPAVSITDPQGDVVFMEQLLDGAPYLGGPVDTEGSHTLVVRARDSGNLEAMASVTFTIDRTTPTIAFAGVTDGGVYSAPVMPAVVFQDANLVSTSTTLDGGPFTNGTAVAGAGAHALAATARDCAGNESVRTAAFAIDLTPPVVSVDVLACSAMDLVPVVTASDDHLALLEMLLDGEPYLGAPVTVEGNHTLIVRARDAGGLEATATKTFIVDRTPPGISVAGVADGGKYNTDVVPVVTISDANLVASETTLNGAFFTSGTPVALENAYTLTATARDCAGNNADRSLGFLIDLTPPMVTIDVPACSAGVVTPTITISDTHLASTQQRLDDAPYQGGPIGGEGRHRIEVTATDTATNQTVEEAAVVIDTIAPVVTISGVTDSVRYISAVTPLVAVSDANLSSTTITLNGAPFVSGATIEAEGPYTLAVTAADCAGNRAVRSVAFEIRPIAGNLSHEISARGRVLLATECTGCPPAPSFLKSVLVDAAIPFEEAYGRDAWLAKMRSGRFNQYFLYGTNPPESGTAFQELNEAIWLGDGLVLIKDHADAVPSLREGLGLDFGGSLSGLSSISLVTPPLAPASVTASGSGAWLRLFGARVAGTVGTRTVAAFQGAGLGKSVTLGWDTETSQSATLYLTALAAASPANGMPLLPGGHVELRAIVRNTGGQTTSYTVEHTLDSGLTSPDPLTHTLSVPTNASDGFFLRVRLPDQVGGFSVSGTLTANGAVLDTNAIVVQVARGRGQIQADVINALNALSLAGGAASKRTHAITKVLQAADTSDMNAAIGLVLDAIDNVRQISGTDVGAIRVDLARLLRTYQVRWTP